MRVEQFAFTSTIKPLTYKEWGVFGKSFSNDNRGKYNININSANSPWAKHLFFTVLLLNSELPMKGHSSLVDTILSDQKLVFYITELLKKGQIPVVDTLRPSQGCPL